MNPCRENLFPFAPRPRRIQVPCLGILALLAIGHAGILSAEEPLQPRAAIDTALTPLIETYCLDCHSQGAAEADLELDLLLDAASAQQHRRQWTHVITRLRQGDMPPEDAEQPPEGMREAAADWLQAELDSLDCSLPANPGKVTLRRLNRTEYGYTIQDWLGIEFDASKHFPQDELGYGFDNIGDVLSMSPLLLEKYLEAAQQIAARAIVTPESIGEPAEFYDAHRLRGGDRGRDDVRVRASNGKISAKFHCEAAGRYLLRARVYATQAGDELTKMELSAGDEALKVVDVAADESDPQTFIAQFDAEPGKIEVAAVLVNDLWLPEAKDPKRRDRNLYVASLAVVGPVDGLLRNELPEVHRYLLPELVTQHEWVETDQWRPIVDKALRQWTLRAFRRPPSDREINQLTNFVAEARQRGDSYQRAMQLALQGVLASPSFLFRGESDPASAGGVRPLDQFEVATRLSYFLWSSTPDERLLRLAGAGKLLDQLDAEVDRMIADGRSDRMIANFGEQWLETRNLETLERIEKLFPEFDAELRAAMRQEPILFLTDMWRNDAPLTTLLSADYSFVNGRLAEHYGASPPEGPGFQKAKLPERRQIGLLGQAGVLAVTSYPDRTSPVIRGKWILERLLNDPPPPPPPDVPELAESTGMAEGTLRERLEQHRADPTCAACHRRMDPLGFAMENFDAVGKWRQEEGGAPIDAAGELPDGRQLSGPAELRDILLADFDRVRRALAEQILTFALGRGLEYYDQCTVERVVEQTIVRGDSLGSLARAIVHSPAFLQTNESQ